MIGKAKPFVCRSCHQSIEKTKSFVGLAMAAFVTFSGVRSQTNYPLVLSITFASLCLFIIMFTYLRTPIVSSQIEE